MEYLASEEQLTDGLTKALQTELFERWRGKFEVEREQAGQRGQGATASSILQLVILRLVERVCCSTRSACSLSLRIRFLSLARLPRL
jgi:hypothetical protein